VRRPELAVLSTVPIFRKEDAWHDPERPKDISDIFCSLEGKIGEESSDQLEEEARKIKVGSIY